MRKDTIIPLILVASLFISSLAAAAGVAAPPCPLDAEPPADGSCDPLAFSNGDRIRKSDGTYIDPRSHEGMQIEEILARQRRDAEENARQKELFWKLTNASNAAEAERILKEARAKDPNAGTPNRIVYTGRKAARREAETVRLREALAALSRGEALASEQQALVEAHFPEGVTFMSKEEYRQRALAAPETLSQGVVTVDPSGRVDIHTKVGVRSTTGTRDEENYRFSNGKLFARKDGTLISPESPEGSKIEGMLQEYQAPAEPQEERQARLAGANHAPSDNGENAAERAAVWKKTRGDPAHTFSNGNQIRHKGGTPIRVDSAEGKQIQAILDRQKADRAANQAQSELFWKVTRAKNAYEALDILKAAKAKDPNAGTPNTTYRRK